jgi:hypothetical protein
MFARKKLSIHVPGSVHSNRLFLTSREFELMEESVRHKVFAAALELSPRDSPAFRSTGDDGMLGFVPELLDEWVHVKLRAHIGRHADATHAKTLLYTPSPPRMSLHAPLVTPPSPLSFDDLAPLLDQECDMTPIATDSDDGREEMDMPSAGSPPPSKARFPPPFRRVRPHAGSFSEAPVSDIDLCRKSLKDSGRAEMYLKHVRETVRFWGICR